jgi:hypothetical protein
MLIGGVINFNNYYLFGFNSGEKMGTLLSDFRTTLGGLRKDQVLAVIMMLINPVTIYISTQVSGFGIQFPLFRIEMINQGYSVISIIQDLNFVTFWLVLWVFGVGILLSGIILSFLEQVNIQRSCVRTGILVIVAGIFFLLSVILQNNFKFENPGILIIPLGIPVMMLLGGWIVYYAKKSLPTEQPGE